MHENWVSGWASHVCVWIEALLVKRSKIRKIMLLVRFVREYERSWPEVSPYTDTYSTLSLRLTANSGYIYFSFLPEGCTKSNTKHHVDGRPTLGRLMAFQRWHWGTAKVSTRFTVTALRLTLTKLTFHSSHRCFQTAQQDLWLAFEMI